MADCFPAGLGVLVVDGDSNYLDNLDRMLTKCNYKVTKSKVLQEARDLLREKKDGFDIVICDMDMPDDDAFKFLDEVAVEMSIPVIMMSGDGNERKVMESVRRGACSCLHKPVRLREFRNIWQHVVRNRMCRGTAHAGARATLDESGTKINADSRGEVAVACIKKRTVDDVDNKQCGSDSSKKSRVVWSAALHQKFLEAVHQIGFEKVGPKKILHLMGETGLTRENVASHLQKYRLNLNRQKENQQKAAAALAAVRHLDMPPQQHPAGNLLISQDLDTNKESYAHMIQVYNPVGQICQGNSMDSIVSLEPAKPSFNQSLGSFNSSQYSLGGEAVPSLQFNHEIRPHFQAEHQVDNFSHCAPLDSIPQRYRPSSRELNKPTQTNITSAYSYNQPQCHITNCFAAETNTDIWSGRTSHPLEHDLYDMEMKNLTFGTGYPYQSHVFLQNNENPVDMKPFGCTNQPLIYDVSQVDFDSPFNYASDMHQGPL